MLPLSPHHASLPQPAGEDIKLPEPSAAKTFSAKGIICPPTNSPVIGKIVAGATKRARHLDAVGKSAGFLPRHAAGVPLDF